MIVFNIEIICLKEFQKYLFSIMKVLLIDILFNYLHYAQSD